MIENNTKRLLRVELFQFSFTSKREMILKARSFFFPTAIHIVVNNNSASSFVTRFRTSVKILGKTKLFLSWPVIKCIMMSY